MVFYKKSNNQQWDLKGRKIKVKFIFFIYFNFQTTTSPTIISGPSASISVNPLTSGKSSDGLTPLPSSVSIQHSNTALGHVSVITGSANTGPAVMTQAAGSGPISVGPSANNVSISGPVTVTSRRANNTSVTMINSNNSNANHR